MHAWTFMGNSYQRLGVERARRVCEPLLVMSDNRVRLTDRSELSLSRWIAVHIRVVPFAELMGHLVSGNPWIDGWVEDTL